MPSLNMGPPSHAREARLSDQMLVISLLVVVAVVISIAAAGVALTIRNGLGPAIDLQVRQEIVRLSCTLGGVEKDGQELISCVPRTAR